MDYYSEPIFEATCDKCDFHSEDVAGYGELNLCEECYNSIMDSIVFHLENSLSKDYKIKDKEGLAEFIVEHFIEL